MMTYKESMQDALPGTLMQADYLGVKHIADADALLVHESNCSLAAVMKDFDHIPVLQQGVEALQLQVTRLLLHIKCATPLR